jgi:nucleotide-binding universal stress UspA family protein
VRVVHAWTFGYIGASIEGYSAWSGGLGAYTSLGVDLSDLQRAAEGLLERALAAVGDETEGVEIERRVVQGPAAEVLVRAAAANDLLVVGSRGHGGFVGLLLGSVSQQCVHHAPCPVVVVHATKPTGSARASDRDGRLSAPVPGPEGAA